MKILSTFLLLFGLLVNVSLADSQTTASNIQALLKENLEATGAEDLKRMMNTIHSKSPAYQQTQQQVKHLFETYDVKYTLLSFTFIGSDNDYAVARIKQRTTKEKGPQFQDNELDLIQVFRKENGKWKFWTQSILEMTFLHQ